MIINQGHVFRFAVVVVVVVECILFVFYPPDLSDIGRHNRCICMNDNMYFHSWLRWSTSDSKSKLLSLENESTADFDQVIVMSIVIIQLPVLVLLKHNFQLLS